MHYFAPGSIDIGDAHAVAAYVLNLNGLLTYAGSLDQHTSPRMISRDVFVAAVAFNGSDKHPRLPCVAGTPDGEKIA